MFYKEADAEKPEGARENRSYKYSKGFFRTVMVLAIATRTGLICMTLTTPAIAITTVACIGSFVVHAYPRVKRGKVHVIKRYELR